ncbi:hypothetical protein SGQ83_09495 [Flavobacterium sp. Fl-318]|uniref:DUF2157 domain-containing protein n=1 Tax=Flavobacterium cupriresistens TaxID=2893885 RepID=A0ABU4RAH5_9FLAO|nr:MULTISPECIES: hypothetical protein [unclassified Flavobacterium]MDX6189582.1 hypothetical protein [Flavobacterium sp. Fl-318]UFH41011.1 hypothetical protein LNP23_14460 [Flavobacterium sp. F-323]
MIVLDKNKLDNSALTEEAEALKNAGFIGKEQFNFIKKELLVLNSHKNILVRIGFFLLGSFLYASLCGAVSLFGLSGIDSYWKVLPFVFAAIGFVGSELLAKQGYHNHGLDDAFILGTLLNTGLAIGVLSEGENVLSIMIAVTVVSFILYLRYLHLLSALVFYLALTVTLGYAIFEFLEFGQAILPFFMLLYGAGTYYFCRKLLKDLSEPFYYSGIVLIKSISLILFYLSGNYMVVRELSGTLSGIYYDVSPEIPLAFFFWIFTFAVPVLYLFFALKNKDRIMLWISFIAIAFSFYSFRFYHSVLPVEVALTLGGLLLFAIAFFSIKKLKTKETGLTFKPDRISNSNDFLNAEALIIASTFGMKPEVKPADSPMEFGGGGFSGGGSEGSF